jgi:carbamoyltransferase
MNILGISAYYHDSAACLVCDGKIIAAAQEERFTRKKHDSAFPENAIIYCLKEAGLEPKKLDYVVFYDKPLLKFERIIETYLNYAPRGVRSFSMSMPLWIREKLFLSGLLKKEMNRISRLFAKDKINWDQKFLFTEHHQSHAASAFFPSPFKSAAILTIDGVGEWATTSLGIGKGKNIDILYELHFPHSLGLLYSAFTYYTGFKVNSGEYKVMGLAPYGEPKYTKLIYDNLIDLKTDGSFTLNMDYFNYCTGLTMTNAKFDKLFGAPPRTPETKITQKDMDIARSIQDATEEVVLRMVKFLKKETGEKNLCLAGGVALNCVSNGKVLKSKIFDNIWVQPCAGDAGGALGSALCVWHQYLGNERNADEKNDLMLGAYLGPHYKNKEIENFLNENNIPFSRLEEEVLIDKVAMLLSQGKIVGWFQGRMEFGPRALGSRSIVADARDEKMQSFLNLKIKHRESFRPFAPSVLREKITDYFDLDLDAPYMMVVAPIKKERRFMQENNKNLWGIELLNTRRSDIPAVTHIDYSARVQTVHKELNPRYYKLIKAFEEKTGCAVIVNTSFNVRGEPIVCSPEDAYRCFIHTDMDYLILEDFILEKKEQKQFIDKFPYYEKELALD